jgi:hypothetical protein
MSAHPLVRNLFGRFQNLNLLFLREDVRRGWAARGDWSSSGNLCPLAHGLTCGEVVRQLRWLSQAFNIDVACREAAKHLGALPIDVSRFVTLWDGSAQFGPEWLARQLDALWAERLADADCVQSVLAGGSAVRTERKVRVSC